MAPITRAPKQTTIIDSRVITVNWRDIRLSSSSSSRDARRENKSCQERILTFLKEKKGERILISYYITIYSSSSTAAMVEPPPSTHVFVLVAPFGESAKKKIRIQYCECIRKSPGADVSFHVMSREQTKENNEELNQLPGADVIILPSLRRNDYKCDNQWKTRFD